MISWIWMVLAMVQVCRAGTVLELTNENFNEVINKNEFVLVDFFAPWCGHCKELEPEFKEAAKLLKEDNHPAQMAKVDATVHKELANRYKISRYPSIILFRSGIPLNYMETFNGHSEIVDWVNEKCIDPVIKVSTIEEAKKEIEKAKVALVGFFSDLKTEEAKHFYDTARGSDTEKYVVTSSEEVMSHYETKDKSAILFKDKGKSQLKFDGLFKDLDSWVKVEKLPLVIEFNQDMSSLIFESDVKAHFVAFATDADKKRTMSALKDSAQKYRGKLLFVVMTKKDESAMRFFGIEEEDIPLYIIVKVDNQHKFIGPKKQALQKKKVAAFLKDYEDGKLERYVKTEALPAEWDKYPLKYLNAANLKQVAFDKSKHVFLSLYVPYDRESLHVNNDLATVAENLQSMSDSLTVAKIDVTKNDIDDIKMERTPTLVLIKKGTNEIVSYSGKKTVDDISKYLTGIVEGTKESPKEEL